LAERAFVLTPLAEIAPDLVHPLLGRTIAELSIGAGEAAGVRKVGTLETLRTG
jgi:7,8-dihydro-6-hydroxymethylpterin-pyrophosphokinase